MEFLNGLKRINRSNVLLRQGGKAKSRVHDQKNEGPRMVRHTSKNALDDPRQAQTASKLISDCAKEAKLTWYEKRKRSSETRLIQSSRTPAQLGENVNSHLARCLS